MYIIIIISIPYIDLKSDISYPINIFALEYVPTIHGLTIEYDTGQIKGIISTHVCYIELTSSQASRPPGESKLVCRSNDGQDIVQSVPKSKYDTLLLNHGGHDSHCLLVIFNIYNIHISGI